MTADRARPPYQQNDDLGGIARAKLAATQHKRLAQMLDELGGAALHEDGLAAAPAAGLTQGVCAASSCASARMAPSERSLGRSSGACPYCLKLRAMDCR